MQNHHLFFYLSTRNLAGARRGKTGSRRRVGARLEADGVRGRVPGYGLSLGVDLVAGGSTYERRGGVNWRGHGAAECGSAARFRPV